MDYNTNLNGNGNGIIAMGTKTSHFDGLISMYGYSQDTHWVRVMWDSGMVEDAKTVAGTRRELVINDKFIPVTNEVYDSVFAVEFIEHGETKGAFFILPSAARPVEDLMIADVFRTHVDAVGGW